MFLIVGCGISGAVLAERIASQLKQKVLIIDKRNHIGGNCYDYIDKDTNILLNKYGAHIFHTNDEEVWEYINMFSKWIKYEHKVLSYVDKKYVPIPVNINTVNQLFNLNLCNQKEMDLWLKKNQIKYNEIKNSEEMAKSRVGEVLYQKMIKEYTFKQWNKFPEQLDKTVLERIPVRNNFNNNYFNDKYQVLPEKGYTNFFRKLLENELIEVKLNTDYFELREEMDLSKYKIIYTGPIDRYFNGLPKLEYRSINFEIKRFNNEGYEQVNSVINYPEKNLKYTRSVEYKHFLNQKSEKSIIVYETTTDKGEPYYPVPNKRNKDLYEKYRELSKKEDNIFFLGRLANYKYFNMDASISNSLKFFNKLI